MLIHLTDTLDVVKVSAVEAVVDLLLDDIELAARLDVVFYGHGRRLRDNVRYFFTAFRVDHVNVYDACARVVPGCGWRRVLLDLLNEFAAGS